MTIERFLAQLYTDDACRERFVRDPYGVAREAGFSEADALEIAQLDVESLRLAARSFSRKREARERLARHRTVFARVLRFVGR